MNWVTTNIRLPEDLYMELKMKAAKERKSVASLIRESVRDKMPIRGKNEMSRSNEKLIKDMRRLGEEIARENPGLNLTKALIEMRYEQ